MRARAWVPQGVGVWRPLAAGELPLAGGPFRVVSDRSSSRVDTFAEALELCERWGGVIEVRR